MENENEIEIVFPEKYGDIPIKDISIHNDVEWNIFDNNKSHILIEFNDNSFLKLRLSPQCCEKLYFTTDEDRDDIKFLFGEHQSGNPLKKILLKKILTPASDHDELYDVPVDELYYDVTVHEISFLEIVTYQGSLTFTAHNENNNGYYGGFNIVVEEGDILTIDL